MSPAPHGAYAEYTLAWEYATFRIPDHLPFESAATVPLSGLTAAVGLYRDLSLPSPWTTDEDRPETAGPLFIYGAGTAVGAFAVQLARKSGVHPIIAVAGESKDYVETLIDHSKGDVVLDYRVGPEKLVAKAKEALAGRPLISAFDAMGEHGSDKIVGALLQPQNARLAITLPNDRTKIPEAHGVPFLSQFALPKMEGVPEGMESLWTALGTLFVGYKEFAYIFSRYLALGLKGGWLKPHRHELVSGGLDGIADGLAKLQEGKAHGVKYVIRIADTKGLEQ